MLNVDLSSNECDVLLAAIRTKRRNNEALLSKSGSQMADDSREELEHRIAVMLSTENKLRVAMGLPI